VPVRLALVLVVRPRERMLLAPRPASARNFLRFDQCSFDDSTQGFKKRTRQTWPRPTNVFILTKLRTRSIDLLPGCHGKGEKLRRCNPYDSDARFNPKTLHDPTPGAPSFNPGISALLTAGKGRSSDWGDFSGHGWGTNRKVRERSRRCKSMANCVSYRYFNSEKAGRCFNLSRSFPDSRVVPR